VPSLAPAAAELCWALSRLAWSDGVDRSNAGQTVAQLAAVAGPSLERCSGRGLTQLVEALQSWALHPGVCCCWWWKQLPLWLPPAAWFTHYWVPLGERGGAQCTLWRTMGVTGRWGYAAERLDSRFTPQACVSPCSCHSFPGQEQSFIPTAHESLEY
jgi:hypothetical protein